MSTLEAIQLRIKKLQVQAEKLAAKQATATLDRIRDLMNKHGLTVRDIDGHLKGQKRHAQVAEKHTGNGKSKPMAANGKLAAKYMNPKTGETWSGWARPPAWIKDVKDRSKFLIENGTATAATKTSAKTTTHSGAVTAHKGRRTGPQPAKYRDPETGATWSGRGPAPAWLAGAKDRATFLIAPASTLEAKQRSVKAKASKSKAIKANGAMKKKAIATSAAVRKTPVTKKVAAPATKKRVTAKTPGRKSVAVKNAAPSAPNGQPPEAASAS